MKPIIVGDSSLDLNDDLQSKIQATLVPFHIDVGQQHFIDDETLNVPELLKAMKAYPKAPQTAAPSPNDFFNAYLKGMEVFSVTISSKLSATYSNAMLAKTMIEEKFLNKIHVVDSKSASSGETLIGLKLIELMSANLGFEELVEAIEHFRDNMKTFFVLESLDNLVKNGRMSKVAGMLAQALSIKPLCAAEDGDIIVLEKTRGIKTALKRLVEVIGEESKDQKERDLIISHCNAPKRAEEIKNSILSRYEFRSVHVVETRGLSTVYANDGGIIVSF